MVVTADEVNDFYVSIVLPLCVRQFCFHALTINIGRLPHRDIRAGGLGQC